MDSKGNIVKVFLLKHDLVGQLLWAEHVKAEPVSYTHLTLPTTILV